MKDIEIILENKAGTLALMGETLGKNNISLEGGGVFALNGVAIGHFLVKEAEKAKSVLEAVGIMVPSIRDVVVQKLRQDIPGQLGTFCSAMAEAQVNILVQYSDHANQLIIVPDHYQRAKSVSENWMRTWWNSEDYSI